MIWGKNMDYSGFNTDEEIRNGFLVDSKRKKVWCVELKILESFDIFCKAKGLQYFVDYGTLLGAVRHKGFVPWDDDIDVTMPRPDYTRFVNEANSFFAKKFPDLWIQNYYTDNTSQRAMMFSRIRDDRTTMLEKGYVVRPNSHMGIWIDIFPLDIAPENPNSSIPQIVQLAVELWQTVSAPRDLLNSIIEGNVPVAGIDETLEIMGLPFRDRFVLFENILNDNYSLATSVNVLVDIFKTPSMKKEWYSDSLMLPFENTMVRAPIAYHEVLSTHYGDYMTPIMLPTDHELELVDPDKSYMFYVTDE